MSNIISTQEEGYFTVTITGPAPIAAPEPIAADIPPSTGQWNEFTITISGGTPSPALSLGSDVTPAAKPALAGGGHAPRPASAGGGHAPRPALARGGHASRPVLAGGGSASRPALAGGGSALAGGERHIVFDWSNISIGAMNHCGGRGASNKDVRIDICQTTELLAAGRPVGTCYVAGSIPSKGKIPPYGAEFQKLGYTAEWLIRDDRTGEERGVDSCLHAVAGQIALDKFNNSGTTRSTETLVLVTGDGNMHTGKSSFPRVAESAANAGLRVEIWSWEATLSGEFARIAAKYPGRVTIHLLDRFKSKVCYVKK